MIDPSACPALPDLQRFLLAQLRGEDAAAMKDHLSRCRRCLKALQTLRKADAPLHATRAPATAAGASTKEPATAVPAPPSPETPTVTTVRPVIPPPAPPQSTMSTPPTGGLTEGYYNFLAPPGEPAELGRLGPYRVLKVLGAGGMGVVFRAYDPDLERPVALKAMTPALAANPSARMRFLREARAAAAIKHDHIVTIYQVGEDHGAPFLAMELLEGESLHERLKREGRLSVKDVLRIGREIADGLAAAHKRGLIHRDVKPANVWLEGDEGRVKILDFGLVCAPHAADEAPPAAPAAGLGREVDAHSVPGALAPPLTQQGAVLGTPAYMAPEQAEGRPVDARSDLFSLGCVLYRLATGELPFKGDSTLSILRAVCTATPPPPERLNPELPEAFCALVRSLLAKKADDRPPSARAVVEAIRAIEESETPGAGNHGKDRCAARPRRKPSRWRWAAVAAGILAVGAAGCLFAAAAYRLLPGRGRTAVEVPANPSSAQPVRVPTLEELAKRPSAADALRREDIAPVALAWAGLGDPKRAPPELVGVLGETRFRLLGAPYYPAYSPDGKLLAVASGSQVMLFEARTGQYLRTFVGHAARVGEVVFNPDGLVLASGGDDHTVKLWDVTTAREIRTLCGHAGGVDSLAFTPDGQTLASAGKDHTVRLWQVATGEQRRLIAGPCNIWRLAFHPEGRLLAGGGADGAVHVWDASDGTLRYQDPRARPGSAKVAFSPDGKTLACGNDVEVKLWDAVTFRHLSTIPTPASGLLSFAPDGRSLLTGLSYYPAGDVPTVKRWETDTGKGLAVLKLPDEQGWLHYRLSPDGKTLAATSYEQRLVRLYDANTGQPRFPSSGHPSAAMSVTFSPDGKTVASGGLQGDVRLHDAATGKELLTLSGQRGQVMDVAFSPDSKVLASAGRDGSVLLREAAGGRLLRTLAGSAASVDQVAFSPDGRTLAGAGWDKAVHLWDVESGRQVRTLKGHTQPIQAVAFSPDGQILASGDRGGELMLWDVASGREKLTQTLRSPIGRLAFFPDGQTLAATQDTAGSVVLLSTDSGTRRRTLTTPGPVGTRALSVRADGGMLAVGASSGAVQLWDLSADPPVGRVWRLLPGDSPIPGVAFSPEGRYLAAAGADGVLRILRAPEHVRLEPSPPPAAPFRVDLNGLAGKQSVDATTFPPSWRKEGVFAAITGPGEATFPSLPATRYVWDADLDVLALRGGSLHLQTGDLDIRLDGDALPEMVRCQLLHRYAGIQWQTGERRFSLKARLRLRLVVTETQASLLRDDVPFLSSDCKPTDLALRIRSEGRATATVLRCSCRPLEDGELRALSWPLPPAGPTLDPAAAARRLQALTAGLDNKPAPGKRFVVGAVGCPMAWIPPGLFGLGALGPAARAWVQKHPVRLTRGFWVGQNPVTQGEWAELMPANPSRFRGSPYLPVDTVRREDALRYCKLLTDREKAAGRVPEGYEYRLPTEAEWEYAGRAGSAADIKGGPEQSWYDLTSTRQPHEVGGLPPNRWGLYDMQGNVRQWCYDAWYDYPKADAGVVENPHHFGDPATSEFVVRGGAWWSRRESNGIFERDRLSSDNAVSVGFRIVLAPALRRD